MTFKVFLEKILFLEILKGMFVTLKSFFSKPVTRQYPEEKRPVQPGFRGLHALAKYPTGKLKCVGCGLCAAFCPSKCIHIYTSEGDDNKKVVDRYEIDVSRCVFCGFCVEACPYGAIVMTEHYEYSDTSRDAFYYTMDRLLENWDKYMTIEKADDYYKRFWHPKSEYFKKESK